MMLCKNQASVVLKISNCVSDDRSSTEGITLIKTTKISVKTSKSVLDLEKDENVSTNCVVRNTSVKTRWLNGW